MEEKEKKVGVFLARFQPLHNAHLYVIEQALKECDKVIIMLGSSNKKDMLRNPFSFELRYEMLKQSLQNKEDINRIEVYELPDWSQESIKEDDKVWGHYLYYNVVARAKQKKMTFYYSDEPEIMQSWFDDEIKPYVNFRFMERSNIMEGLSSTKIRRALINLSPEDKQYLKRCLPKPVYDNIAELRKIWIKTMENPQPDFSMK